MDFLGHALRSWDAPLEGLGQLDAFNGQTATTSALQLFTYDSAVNDRTSSVLTGGLSAADEWNQLLTGRQTLSMPPSSVHSSSTAERVVEPVARKESDVASLSPTVCASGAYQKKLATAREAQKRFRARQKARSLSIEAKLANTTAELHESKEHQQHLANRNALLEKLDTMNSKLGSGKIVAADATYEQLFTACDTRASEKGPAVHVSVWGEHCTMSVHDVSQLPLKDFCSLWTEYVRKLTQYLLQLSGCNDVLTTAQMQQLTVEAAALVFCLKLYNPEAQHAFVNSKLDEGQLLTEGPDPTHYPMLLRALELSKKQIHNLLLLRQLHLAKRAQLARDRHQLLQQMMIDTHGVQHSGNGMTRMLRLATDLKANTAEDYCVYNRIVCAVLRGVIILP